MDWMHPEVAKKAFGLASDEELEEFVAEYDLDVELDEEDNVIAVGTAGIKEAVFKDHEKKVGHRPDDWREMEKAQKEHNQAELHAQQRSQQNKEKLKQKLGHG